MAMWADCLAYMTTSRKTAGTCTISYQLVDYFVMPRFSLKMTDDRLKSRKLTRNLNVIRVKSKLFEIFYINSQQKSWNWMPNVKYEDLRVATTPMLAKTVWVFRVISHKIRNIYFFNFGIFPLTTGSRWSAVRLGSTRLVIVTAPTSWMISRIFYTTQFLKEKWLRGCTAII